MDVKKYTLEEYTEEEARLYFGMWKSVWMQHGKKRTPKEHEWMVKIRNLRKPILRIGRGPGDVTFTEVTLSIVEYIQAEYAFQRGDQDFWYAKKAYENMEKTLENLANLFIDFPLKNIRAWTENTDVNRYATLTPAHGIIDDLTRAIFTDIPNGNVTATTYLILMIGFLRENLDTTLASGLAAGVMTLDEAEEHKVIVLEAVNGIMAEDFEGFTKGIQRAAQTLFSINTPIVFENEIDALVKSKTALESMIAVGAAVRVRELAPELKINHPSTEDHISGLFEEFIRAIKKVMTTLHEHGYHGNAFSHFNLKCMKAGTDIGIAMDDYGMTGQRE